MISELLLALAVLPQPDTYYLVSRNSEGAYLVDPSTIKKHGETLTYWNLWVNAKPQKLPFSGELESYVLEREEVDCENDKRQRLALVSYDAAGEPIGSNDVVPIWRDTIPGSVGQTLQRFVCGGVSPSPARTWNGALKDVVKGVRDEMATMAADK